MIQIEELKITHQLEMAAHQKEMAAIRAQFSEIKNSLVKPESHYQNKDSLPATYIPPQRRYGGSYGSEYTQKRCSKCLTEKRTRCFHCFGCGSTEHRLFRCPNQKNV